MADRIQQRRDTAARWAQFNPILLEGEVGYVTDDPNQYKIGDGVHAWNELPLRGFDGTLVHELGTSETAAMSQKAVTTALGVKTIIFPQAHIVNLDLNNNKVVISAGDLYVTSFNNNAAIHTISAQEIDITDKWGTGHGDSGLFYNITDRTFKFLNYSEQVANLGIDDAIVALIYQNTVYYQSCDIYINGVLSGFMDVKNKFYNFINNTFPTFQNNVNYDTISRIAGASSTFSINLSTGEYTYTQLNVMRNKGDYNFNVPAGNGTYIGRGEGVTTPNGLSAIFFNVSTLEVVWCEFDHFSDYSGTQWVVLAFIWATGNAINVLAGNIGVIANGVSISNGERIDDLEDKMDGFSIKTGNLVRSSDFISHFSNDLFSFFNNFNHNITNTLVEDEELATKVLNFSINNGLLINETNFPRIVVWSINKEFEAGTVFYIRFKYKGVSDNHLYPVFLINGTWGRISNALLVDNYFASNYGSNGVLRQDDGKWHEIMYKMKANTDADAISSISLAMFYNGSSAYTYTQDAYARITDLYVGTVDPRGAIMRHEDDFIVSGRTLYTNEYKGSDLLHGFDASRCPALSNASNYGGTASVEVDEDSGERCLKLHFPTGQTYNGYNNVDVFKTDNKTYNAQQVFYVSVRYKLSASVLGIAPIINNGWGQFKYWNNWKSISVANEGGMRFIRDGKWHTMRFIIRPASTADTDLNVSIRLFLANGQQVTLDENVDASFSNFIVSTTPFDINDMVYNEEDFPSQASFVNNNVKGCVFMSLGDSITTESYTYYIQKLRHLIQPSKYYSLAVAGAHWADKANTVYDGNPVFNGSDNNANNVIGNQVQKILNGIDSTYSEAPDIIIIAAGTNDGNPVETNASQNTIITEVDSHFQSDSTPIPITSQTDSDDTYKTHRQTIAGAMRYAICTLQKLYPKARIYVCTPIQGGAATRNYNSIEVKQRYISEAARHLGVPVIHVGEECGIQSDWEYNGAMWTAEEFATDSLPQNGRDLRDALHPNNNGGWKMANYIYQQLVKDYIPQYYE